MMKGENHSTEGPSLLAGLAKKRKTRGDLIS
jgi:hypothetical protein